MLIVRDPKEYDISIKKHVCDFHKKTPGKHFAGCTCSSNYDYKRKNPDEKRPI